jgi:hypothetical protein
MVKTAPLAVGLLLLLGCAQAFAPARLRWPKPSEEARFLLSGDMLQITGVARADLELKTETQRRSDARDRALIDAWSRLRAYVEALPVGDSTVGELSEKDPALKDRLERLVYSARPVHTRFDEGGLAAASVELERAAINKALGTDFR